MSGRMHVPVLRSLNTIRLDRKDHKVSRTSRYGVKEADIDAIIAVFSSHLPLNDYADSQNDFADSRHVIMRAIDYVWGDSCAYRALQIAMLRLIATKHKALDKSDFIPFMISMDGLPWNKAHGWYLMRTKWAKQTIYNRYIPLNRFTVNKALTHGAPNCVPLEIRRGAVYRIGNPTEMQHRILSSDSDLFLDVLRSNIAVLGKSAVNSYVKNVVCFDNNKLVETLPFIPPDYLSNGTCVQLFNHYGDHFAFRHAILRRIPYRISDHLWSTIKKYCFNPIHPGGNMDHSVADVFRTVPYLSKKQILDIATIGDADLMHMLFCNKNIAWDRALVSQFLMRVSKGSLRIRDLAMDAFHHVGFISDALFQEVSSRDSWGDLNYTAIVSADKPLYRYLKGAELHRPSEAYNDGISELHKLIAATKEAPQDTPKQESAESAPHVQVISGTYIPTEKEDKWVKYLDRALKNSFEFRGALAGYTQDSTDAECRDRIACMCGELDHDFPNFKSVTRILLGQVLSCSLAGQPLHFQPMVLLGDAGIGKTSYLQAVCDRLSVYSKRVDMGNVSAGFALSGSHGVWRGGQPGIVAKTFLTVEPCVANPVFILDEIDKAQGSDQHPVYPALLPMIERATAKTFQDEFLEGITIDLSYASFVMTANSVKDLPDSFQSRVIVIDVPAPTPAEKRIITERMYTIKKQDMLVTERYAEHLDAAMLDKLCTKSLRDVDRMLTLAMTNALMRMGGADKVVISEADLEMGHIEKRVGFL